MKKKFNVEFIALREKDTIETAFDNARFQDPVNLKRYVKACNENPDFYDPIVTVMKVTYERVNLKEVLDNV